MMTIMMMMVVIEMMMMMMKKNVLSGAMIIKNEKLKKAQKGSIKKGALTRCLASLKIVGLVCS